MSDGTNAVVLAAHAFIARPAAISFRHPGATSHATSACFQKFTFPANSRRYGLLTQAALLAATSSPTDSSPMLRGRMVQQDFLCRPIPDPPLAHS